MASFRRTKREQSGLFNHLKQSLTCQRTRGKLITEEPCTVLSDEPQTSVTKYAVQDAAGSHLITMKIQL